MTVMIPIRETETGVVFRIRVVPLHIPPLRELGGEAARYLPPRDPAVWAAAVRALTADEGERTRLAMAGRARAADFQYSRTAAEMLEVLRAVAKAT